MPAEFYPEHVEALTLEPICGFPEAPDTLNLERAALGKLCLHSQKTTERKRPKMPYDFDRLVEIPILDRGDVAQVVVALRGVVAKPPHYLEQRVRRDIDDRLPPHDQRPFDRQWKFLEKRSGAWVCLTGK